MNVTVVMVIVVVLAVLVVVTIGNYEEILQKRDRKECLSSHKEFA